MGKRVNQGYGGSGSEIGKTPSKYGVSDIQPAADLGPIRAAQASLAGPRQLSTRPTVLLEGGVDAV